MIHPPVAVWQRAEALLAPTGVTAARDGLDVLVDWTHAGGGGATGFRVYRRSRVPAGAWSAYGLVVTVTPQTDTDWIDTTAVGELEYQYRVHAWTGSVESAGAESNVVGVVDPIEWAFGYPADYVPDDFSIAWGFDAAMDQSGLQVWWRDGASMGADPTATGTLAYEGILTSNTINTGSEDNLVYVIARARYGPFGSYRYGPWSQERSVTSRPRVPGVPTGVSLAATGPTEITLSWTPGPPTTHDIFDVEYRTRATSGDPWGAWTAPIPPTDSASPYVYTAVIEGQEYQMRVRGRNTGGSSAWAESNTVCAAAAPSVPTLVSVSTTGVADPTQQLRVVYSGDGGNTIELRYRVSGTTPWLTDQGPDTNGSPFDLVGLNDGTPHDVQIRAVNACGVASAWTATVPGTTQASAPTTAPTFAGPAPVHATDDEIDVSWTHDAIGATDYDIEWAQSVSQPASGTLISGVGTSGSYNHTGRSPNTSYWYRVRGTNSGGTGPWSAWKQAYTHIEIPNLGAPGTADYPAGCPTLAGITVNLTHMNTGGNARSESMTWQYRWAQSFGGVSSASWNPGGSLSAGASSFNVQAVGADNDYYLQVRVRYDSETAWRTTSTVNAFCFA